MPKFKFEKSYLEREYPNPVLDSLRFLHSGRYSPLVRAMRFALLGLCGDIEADVEARRALALSEQITDESLFSLEWTRSVVQGRLDKQEWSRRFLPYLVNYARKGLPFSGFEDEPAQVSQLKKMINALYHGEEALKIAESIDIDGFSRKENNTIPETLLNKLNPFIDHVYELCMLLTHPDIDLTMAFGDEFRQINVMLFDVVAKIPERYFEQTKFLSKEYGLNFTEGKAIAEHFGHWTGAALDAFKPTRQINYSTVSYFGSDVSTYLNRLTKVIQDTANRYFTAPYLNQDGTKVENYEIHEHRLRELEISSIRLEDALKSLTSGSQIFQPLNAYALIRLLMNATTLVQSIIEESGHFRAESETLIRSAFAQLKYQILLELIKTVDKIEEESAIKPGSLSIGVVQRLDEWYRFLFSFVSGFVDLSACGQDLSCLLDSRLVELRQQPFYERQAEREKNLLRHKLSEESLETFFTLLSQYRGRRLSELSSDQKDQLLKHFVVIQPLIAQDDIALNNTIAEALLPKEPEASQPRVHPKNMGLGEKILDDVVYTGKKIYEGVSSVYAALDEYSTVPRRYLGDYNDRVELLNEGYTFELLEDYDVPFFNAESVKLSDYAPRGMFSSRCIYIRVIDGKLALTVKKPNGSFFYDVVTPFVVPVSGTSALSLEQLEPLRAALLDFAKKEGLIKPSLYERIKHRVKKEEASCAFKAVINADCRAKIYQSSGELLQHPYPQNNDAYVPRISDVLGPEVSSLADISWEKVSSQHLQVLYTRYAVLCRQLDDAQSGMQRFFELVEDAALHKKTNLLAQKNEFRHIYALIQPYFVSSLRQLKGDKFAWHWDQSLIHAFSGRLHQGRALSIQELLHLKAHLFEHMQQCKQAIDLERNTIRSHMEQRLLEVDLRSMVIDNPYGARSGYVVKNLQYTRYMKGVMEQLEQFTKQLFSPEIQKKLIPQDRDVYSQSISLFLQLESKTLPFPEVEDVGSLTYLTQEKQTISLKQFYNCVHHLREIAIQIQELSEESYSWVYVWRTMMIEEHLRHVIVLYQEIKQDPYLTTLGMDLLQSLFQAIEVVKTLSLPYAPEKYDKDIHIEAVRHPVFYIANALVVARDQIDAWQKGKFISQDQQEAAQKFSEDISKKIYKVMESNSYLEWVLQSGMFYELFCAVKERWNNFAVSSTQAIEQNLDSIYTENFTNMLIEADIWERRAGLTPGLISHPLKEIFDAYYLGMIEILSRDKAHQISLGTTQLPLNKRIQHVSLALETERKNLSEAERALSSIQQFQAWSNANSEMMMSLWSQAQTEHQENYDVFLSLLRQVMSSASMNERIQAMIEPDVLSILLLEQKQNMVAINECQQGLKKLVEVCEAFFEGSKKTASLALECGYAQRDALRESVSVQKDKNQKIRNQMIQNLVFDMLKNYQSGQKRLLFIRQLYDSALQQEIESHMDVFLSHLSEHTSIEKQVKQFLDEKVMAFDKKYLDDFYQFNELHYALSELESYLHSQNTQLTKVHPALHQHTWAFESADTLALKSQLHQELKEILDGDSTPTKHQQSHVSESPKDSDPKDPWHIQARIALFKKTVERPRFAHTLLTFEEGRYKISPLSYLVKWFINVLRVLGVYKTEAEIIHEHLKKSAITSRNGMFAPEEKSKNQDVPTEDHSQKKKTP